MENQKQISFTQLKKQLIISYGFLAIIIVVILSVIGYFILDSEFALTIPQGETLLAYILSTIVSIVIFCVGVLFILTGFSSLGEIRNSMPEAIFAGSVFTYVSLIFMIATQMYHPYSLFV